MRPPRLILAAHGSADPRHSAVIDSLVSLVSSLRPGLDVQAGFLEHGEPDLRSLDTEHAVVVPLLLAAGFHLHSDLPAQAPRAVIAGPLAPDPRLTRVLGDRLREAGWHGERPVTLVAAGSQDPRAVEEVRAAADDLSRDLGIAVEAAFASAGEPRLADLSPQAVATYLLAPGHFADVVAGCGAPVIAAPLGAHRAIAELVVSRYDLAAGG